MVLQSLGLFKITVSPFLGDLSDMTLKVGDPRRDLCSFRVAFSPWKLWFVIVPFRIAPVWVFHPGRGSGAGYFSSEGIAVFFLCIGHLHV